MDNDQEYPDIIDLFVSIITQHRSTDIADDVFKKMIHEDQALRARYRLWCHDMGSSEKNGFLDFCFEYLDGQDSVYDSLQDYDDQE